MRAKWIVHSVVVGSVALLVAGWCLALMTVSDEGHWPDTWPEELDALRGQARTIDYGFGLQETVYEIPFVDWEKFEAAWPHILEVKSKGAPLTLVPPRAKNAMFPMEAGVCIHAPVNGATKTPDGKWLKVGPPWPDDIKSDTGVLPAYVTNKDGKWVAADSPDARKAALDNGGLLYRARVDIELVVDSMIVDLNRIRLPANTPIIDRRFKKTKTPRD